MATSFAADAERKETDKRMPALGGKWSFELATNSNPSLPRVLLIGDSICIGYKAIVIKALAGKANVDVWPNPFFQSEKINRELAKVLKYGPYDVVHVNIGLHGVQAGRIQPGTYEPLTRQFIQIIRDTMPKAKSSGPEHHPVHDQGQAHRTRPGEKPDRSGTQSHGREVDGRAEHSRERFLRIAD